MPSTAAKRQGRQAKSSVLAEACASRTHQRRGDPPPDGFEDRGSHRTACASAIDDPYSSSIGARPGGCLVIRGWESRDCSRPANISWRLIGMRKTAGSTGQVSATSAEAAFLCGSFRTAEWGCGKIVEDEEIVLYRGLTQAPFIWGLDRSSHRVPLKQVSFLWRRSRKPGAAGCEGGSGCGGGADCDLYDTVPHCV